MYTVLWLLLLHLWLDSRKLLQLTEPSVGPKT